MAKVDGVGGATKLVQDILLQTFEKLKRCMEVRDCWSTKNQVSVGAFRVGYLEV